MPLKPDDLRHLTAAQGYVDLGMPLEADAELEEIGSEVRHVPEVLEVREGIYRELKKWDLLQAVAKKLALFDPQNAQWWISWAYATRRADCLEAARLTLVNSLEHVAGEPMIHFNLACYQCQLGDLDGAQQRLRRAIELCSELRLLALEDEDLKPLWDSLSGKLDDPPS